VTLFRRAARTVSEKLGRESALVTFLRPSYDRFLAWSSGGRGLRQRVNDEEFLIDPRNRVHFPEVYELNVWRYLKANVRPGQVILNVGAHMGIYALALARWSAPGGRVFAFEPNPETRAALNKHVSLNDLGDRIETVDQAVSDVSGPATFFATGQEGFSRLDARNPDTQDGESLTVQVTTVDAFCAGRGLTPDWITLDIEGFEGAALEGARKTIELGRGKLGIIVEMHPSIWPGPSGAERMNTLLASLGLEPVGLTGQSDPLAEYGVVRLDYSALTPRAKSIGSG
jgi:FkbM family methyltransferase